MMYPLLAFLLISTPLYASTEKNFEAYRQQDHDLARDDQALNSLYQDLLLLIPKGEQEAFKQTQRQWLHKRTALTSLDAIKESYTQRLQHLQDLKQEKEKPYTASFFSTEPTLQKDLVLSDLRKSPTFSCRLYELVIHALDVPQKNRDTFLAREAKALYEKEQKANKLNTKTPWPFADSAKMEDILFVAEHGLYKENRDDVSLTAPLWLVIQAPDLMTYDTGAAYRPYGLDIMTHSRMATLSHYKAFNHALDDLFVGNWQSGTLYRTFYSNQARARDFTAFAPNLLEATNQAPLREDHALHHPELLKWSYLGPWHRKKYQALEKIFPAMVSDLRGFYQSIPPLAAFAPHATHYLNAYVSFNFDTKVGVASEKAYVLFAHKKADDLKTLLTRANDFDQNDWNAALAYAVLSERPLSDLKVLMEKGAKVDAVIDEETPLMKAADRPKVVAFLLAQKAPVDAHNDFGKTALFYAIQFGNLESVKALVSAGADLNKALKVTNEEKYYEFKFVLGLTPLAYSMRYGSPDMTSYLVEKGARIDGINQESLKEWVATSGDEERFHTHLALIKK